MTTRVWIVTQGSYSDYRVARIFATKKAADEYVGARSDDRWSEFNPVESWDVLESAPGRVSAWYGRVVVSADGSQILSLASGHTEPCVWSVGLKDEDEVPARPRVSVRKADFPVAITRVGDGGTEVAVEARTEKGAMKAMMDRAHRIAADKAGVA
jgi:hypothetical protein